MDAPELELRVHAIDDRVAGVRLFDLRRPDGAELPEVFAAGAHVEVSIGGVGVRQYSLFNSPGERDRYRIAVALAASGRGGSAYLHGCVRPGDPLRVGLPRNRFPLVDDDAPSILIAGGIGITPLWAMAQSLEARGRPWRLHYGARSRAAAALLAQIEASGAGMRHGRVELHFSREADGARLDLQRLVEQAPAQAHLYCCGPAAMLQAYRHATRAWPSARVHQEHFEATQAAATGGGYTVELAQRAHHRGAARADPPGGAGRGGHACRLHVQGGPVRRLRGDGARRRTGPSRPGPQRCRARRQPLDDDLLLGLPRRTARPGPVSLPCGWIACFRMVVGGLLRGNK
ncbi:MAG: ferredoxin reductase [Nitrospira sp.]